jgi:hypothetical protein
MHHYGYIGEASPLWSLMAPPVNHSIQTSDIYILLNNNILTWQEALNKNMITIPFFSWNTSIQQYDLVYDKIIPRKGQWIFSIHECLLWSFNYERNFDTFLTTLEPQWNMISTPFDYPITLDRIQVIFNGSSYNWTEAVGNSIIDGNIFGWDSDTQSYVLVSFFEPEKSYWLYGYQSCILKKGRI